LPKQALTTKILLSKKVSQFMNVDILKLNEAVLIPEASRLMQQKGLDEIIVTDSSGEAVGLVTDEDILRSVGMAFAKPHTTRLDDIMTFPIIGISEDATLQEAILLMRDKKKRKLLVFSEQGNIVGIIYRSVIVNLIRKSLVISEKLTSFRSILWNLGTVLQFAGILMLIPSIVATLLSENVVATGVFLMSTLLLIAGFLLNSYGDKHPLHLRDMAILVLSSFFVLVLFGTIPYIYLNPHNLESWTDIFSNSFFSSAAGFTTAGISLFDNPELLPQSFTFFRSFTQFVGGLSFIYLIMTAFYPERKVHSMRSFISGKIPQLRELFVTITVIFSIYAVIISALLWYFGQRNIIDNFSIAISALSTGGFVPRSDFLSNLLVSEYLILAAGGILGALPFAFHYSFIRRKFLSAEISKEVFIYLLFLISAIVFFIIVSDFNPLDAMLTVVGASTTVGYQLVDLQADYIEWIVLILMIIGGCGFSTAGGIKMFRVLQLYEFGKLLRRRTTLNPEQKKEFLTLLLLIALFPILPLLVAAHLHGLGYDFFDSYFDSVGAITTAGMGADVIGLGLDPFSKILVSVLMILGRLEIVMIIYIFVPKLLKL
jgi:trk system potassium uptake protein TrkH